MEIRKAERRKAKLRLAITGPAGSGKTYGALQIAFGLGGKVVLIDTENGSGDLYANLGDYDVCPLSAPYTVQKYIEAISACEKAGYTVIIIDSLSHAWAGAGGLLDMQGKIADNGRKNSFAAWREVTPLQNKLVDTMLSSKAHIIATMRSKTDWIQVENEHGRSEIRKVGLAPVQRDGMEYEFGLVFDLSMNHMCTVSKDRTGLYDGQIFTITQETGHELNEWLNTGKDYEAFRAKVKELYEAYLKRYENDAEKAKEEMQKITGDKPSQNWTESDLAALRENLEATQDEPAPNSPEDLGFIKDPEEELEHE